MISEKKNISARMCFQHVGLGLHIVVIFFVVMNVIVYLYIVLIVNLTVPGVK